MFKSTFDDFYAGIFADEACNLMFIHAICHRDKEIAEQIYKDYPVPITRGELYKTGYVVHFVKPFEFTEIRIPFDGGIIRAYVIEGVFLEMVKQKSNNSLLIQ